MKQFILPLFLLGLYSCQPKPQTDIINLPISKSSDFETDDSSFLKIKMKNFHYEISFLNQQHHFKSVNSLDSFLQANKNELNKEKVIVTNFDTTNKFKEFKEVLSKYNISRFRLNLK